MAKRAARRAASRKTPRTRKAAATKARARTAAKRGTTKSAGSSRYTPPEIQGTGWPPFRYPPQ